MGLGIKIIEFKLLSVVARRFRPLFELTLYETLVDTVTPSLSLFDFPFGSADGSVVGSVIVIVIFWILVMSQMKK